LELPVEPKFKVGDWITNGLCTIQISSIGYENDASCMMYYHNNDTIGGDVESIDKQYHLWNITDAKDGDVLVTEDYIFIFKHILHGGVHLYCHYNIDDEEFDSDIPDAIIGNIHDKGAHFRPATKEQCDLLFAKMKEAGYQWDDEKKELKKIQKHYDISNFYVDMPVLVRDGDCGEWTHTHFSHVRARPNFRFVAGAEIWRQCIPFDNKTKHLLGTTDMCPEEYINW
jgi:hypothetical protein